MDDFQQKIGEILNDPAQLAGILELAKSFGLAPPQDATAQGAAAPPSEAAAPPPPDFSQQAGADAARALDVGSFFQAAKTDNRQENLLRALRPFLKPEKREKIDRAMQIARVSQLAQSLLKDAKKAR